MKPESATIAAGRLAGAAAKAERPAHHGALREAAQHERPLQAVEPI